MHLVCLRQKSLGKKLMSQKDLIKSLVHGIVNGTIAIAQTANPWGGASPYHETYRMPLLAEGGVRVNMGKVAEWCIDYSYDNPTLWVISDNAWYKVASMSGEVAPSKSYERIFAQTTFPKFQVRPSAQQLLCLIPMTLACCAGCHRNVSYSDGAAPIQAPNYILQDHDSVH